MLQRILKKRTRMEKEAWEEVRQLMPRGRKTRGIQYEALEYLFTHLYEPVSESALADHLRQVKGHLQSTGDPVKGAINQAIKELQRLPERTFEIVKIQQQSNRGTQRFVRLNFTRFEEVIGFDLYVEYLQDVLHRERDIVVRGVSHTDPQHPGALFPGLFPQDLCDCRGHFLMNPSAVNPVEDYIEIGYLPDSAAGIRLLLVYEDKETLEPFLGFIARAGWGFPDKNQEFILYRGTEKYSKLCFLDRIWQNLAQQAVDHQQLAKMRAQAGAVLKKCGDQIPGGVETILNGLLLKQVEQSCSIF